MRNSLKKSLVMLSLSLALLLPKAGYCGIWELTRESVMRNRTPLTHQQVLSQLRLLTPDQNISSDKDHEGTVVVAGGYIVVDSKSIRSFKDPTDYKKGNPPEFEFFFEAPGRLEEDKSPSSKADLKGIRIALDIIPSQPYFNEPIGSWTYEQFVVELQKSLGRKLVSAGAEVIILRPNIKLTADTVDELNKNAPQIVISPQFNNDKQDCMITFCGGNILADELKVERQRARFIQAALTGKPLYSAGLGACITKHCQTKLKVQPLAWEKSSFEGNVRPVPVSDVIRMDAALEERGGNFDGIGMRNLAQNGLFAKAAVVPFPDMKWVRGQVVAGNEHEAIDLYAGTITEAVLEYVGKHSAVFH